MVKPIPKKLLFHSILYEEFVEDDWGKRYLAVLEVNNVRLEPINAIFRSNIKDDVEGSTLLFVDRSFSAPYIRLKERSRVTFNGVQYEVMKVNEYPDNVPGLPHHYEIILN